MKFLIEADIFPEEQAKLIAILQELKIEYSVWNKEGRPPYKSAENHVFFYGSIASAIGLQRAGARFQLWIGPQFDYSYFGAHLDDLLNDEFLTLPYGMILRMNKKYPNEKGWGKDTESKLFIRSDSGFKKFQGGLYTVKEFFSEAKRVNLFKEDLLITSEPNLIDAEYRCVIRSEYDDTTGLWSNKVVTSSCYSHDNNGSLEDYAIKKIEDDLNTSTYRPFPMWVLDVVMSNGKLYQLEANSLNTSGLYNCNMKLIVEEILKIEEKEIV